MFFKFKFVVLISTFVHIITYAGAQNVNKSEITLNEGNKIVEHPETPLEEQIIQTEGGSVDLSKVPSSVEVNESKPKKIVPRKGAGNYTEPSTPTNENVDLSLNRTLTESGKVSDKTSTHFVNVTSSSTTISTTINLNTTTTKITTTTTKPTKPHITHSLEEEIHKTDGVKSPSAQPDQNVSSNEQPSYSDNDSNVGGSISIEMKHPDYIAPVVVTIFAVPLFVGLTVILVRKARDFWEKRHYRRMDFLIDGMYND